MGKKRRKIRLGSRTRAASDALRRGELSHMVKRGIITRKQAGWR